MKITFQTFEKSDKKKGTCLHYVGNQWRHTGKSM